MGTRRRKLQGVGVRSGQWTVDVGQREPPTKPMNMPVHPGTRTPRSNPRPLGLLTVRSQSFLEQEKREFQEGLTFLSQILQQENRAVCRMCAIKQNPDVFNNANSAKYYTRVPDRVDNSRSSEHADRIRPVSSSCNRASGGDLTSSGSLHCEVLGSLFCMDCSRMRRKGASCEMHRNMFPNVGNLHRSPISSSTLPQFHTQTHRGDPSTNKLVVNGYVANPAASQHDIDPFTSHDGHSRGRHGCHGHQTGNSFMDSMNSRGWTRPETLDLDFEDTDTYGVNISASVHFNSPIEHKEEIFLESIEDVEHNV